MQERGATKKKANDPPSKPCIGQEPTFSRSELVLQSLSLYPIRGTLPLTPEVTMNKSAMIRARVDPTLKDEVENVFEQ
jgi:hypothetical protein